MSGLIDIYKVDFCTSALDAVCYSLRNLGDMRLVRLIFSYTDRQRIIVSRSTKPFQCFWCDVGIHRICKTERETGHIVHISGERQLAALSISQFNSDLIAWFVSKGLGGGVYNDFFIAQRWQAGFTQRRLELVQGGVTWIFSSSELD